MSKKILAAFVAFSILQIQSNVFAQCPLTTGKPYSCIDQATANTRMGVFAGFKQSIIENDLGAHVSNFTFPNVNKIQRLLQSLHDKTNPDGKPKYDGIRIYFALSEHKPTVTAVNKIYLVLVPTINAEMTEDNGARISDDDEENAFIVSDDNFASVDLNKDHYVEKWINRFQKKVAARIELVLGRSGIKLEETTSLWYSARVMFRNDATDGLGPDLLTYLGTHTITAAEIDLASWPSDPDPNLVFKLSLVFKFTEENGPQASFFTFGATDIKNNIQKSDKTPADKEAMVRILSTQYTDTGNPCKPYKCP